MQATTRSQHGTTHDGRTLLPTPRRFLRCIACGTWKKERAYALCAECFRVNGNLSRPEFLIRLRFVDREAPQFSYRLHPGFTKACRIYGRRDRRRRSLAAIDRMLGRSGPNEAFRRTDADQEEYDGVGAHEIEDILDWQMRGVALPSLRHSEHVELSDEEITAWDAAVDAWVAARGLSLADPPAPEIRPWGYPMRVAGAVVWTDDLVL